ncbi:MAG: TIGR04283 family arsenosugar biosynthesis glycosyltransferase [Gammaproteobacteria bacterium]|nr:MAG: TIGR04283 family arsenosugar biosynthesis glycosyltransferase [Gammaproteobacteria bacterium]
MQLSIIIPVLDEAECIVALLQQLQPLRARGHEVILVDGGSKDETVALAESLVDQLLIAPAGRARQMNAGADAANGQMLWFVHADSGVPDKAEELIIKATLINPSCRRINPSCRRINPSCRRRPASRSLKTVDPGIRRDDDWGRFNIRLSGDSMLLRIVEQLMNLRSRITGIATGDQCIFVSRALFERVGGYADLPLMEDIDLSKRLKREQRPVCVQHTVTTSSRRWEQKGIVRTIVLMWYLRLAWFLGVPAARLATRYG